MVFADAAFKEASAAERFRRGFWISGRGFACSIPTLAFITPQVLTQNSVKTRLLLSGGGRKPTLAFHRLTKLRSFQAPW